MDLKDIVQAAKKAGWSVEQTKGNHLAFTPTDKAYPRVIGAGTPSDWRSLKNLVAQLRRSGLKL